MLDVLFPVESELFPNCSKTKAIGRACWSTNRPSNDCGQPGRASASTCTGFIRASASRPCSTPTHGRGPSAFWRVTMRWPSVRGRDGSPARRRPDDRAGGLRYEMTHANSWHYVRPLGRPTLSLMVTGKPWARKAAGAPSRCGHSKPSRSQSYFEVFGLGSPSPQNEAEVWLRAPRLKADLEDDPVEARELGDDQAGKFGDKARQRLDGVLLRDGPIPTPFWRENAVLAHPFWLRATPGP